MPSNKILLEKQKVVEELKAKIEGSVSGVLVDYKGNVVEGSEKIEKDVYFSTDANGTPVIYSPVSIVTIEENGKYGFGKITYTMPLPTEAEVDSWALKEVVAAIEENLGPDHLQNLYRSNITREEFASLIVETISAVSGKDIDDLVKEKTGKTVYDIMAQYPFSDSTKYPSSTERVRRAMITCPGALVLGQRVTQDMHSPQYHIVSLLSSLMISSSSWAWTMLTMFLGL